MDTQPIESGFAMVVDPRLVLRNEPLRRGRMMRSDMGVYARGAVSHADHATITPPFWHRVMMNTETQSRTMQFLAFPD